MLMLIVKNLGVSYAQKNLGWFGEHLPSLGGALEWSGAFGSAWEMPNGDYDYSLQGRPAQVVGTPVLSPAFAEVSEGNYIETPLTDSGVIAAGTPNSLSMVAVVSGIPATGTAAIISTLGTSVQSGFRLGKANGAGSITLLADNGTETQSSISGPSGLSASGAEFIGVSINGLVVNLYRRGLSDSNMCSASGTLSISAIQGRGVGWRIGRSYAGAAAPAINIGLAGIYNRALSAAEMQEVYQQSKVRMAQRGIQI